jgi:hypothetical protein
MRYLIAILSTLSLAAETLIAPIFLQWYEQQTGIDPIMFYFVGMFLGFFQLFMVFALWWSAINDKPLKSIGF